MRRPAGMLDGIGVPAAVGACLVVLAGVFAYVVLSSPSGWQWFGGKAVAAREDTGTVLYSYGGQSYTIDDTNSFRTGARTVWIDPRNPAQATLHSLVVPKVTDSLFVGLPALLGLALVAGGLIHKRARRTRSDPGPEGGFGAGIDSATISGIVSGRGKKPT